MRRGVAGLRGAELYLAEQVVEGEEQGPHRGVVQRHLGEDLHRLTAAAQFRVELLVDAPAELPEAGGPYLDEVSLVSLLGRRCHRRNASLGERR